MDEKQARALIEGVAGALPETSVDTARLVARGRGRQRRRVGVVTTVAAVVTVAVGGVAIAQVSGGDGQRDATIADQSSTPSTTAHVYLQDGWEPGSRNGGMSQCLHPTSLRKVAVEGPAIGRAPCRDRGCK